MSSAIPLFTLRLGGTRTIGRQDLRQIWRQASNSEQIAVGQTRLQPNGGNHFCVYTLSGLRTIGDLSLVEATLRRLIQARMPDSIITLTRLGG